MDPHKPSRVVLVERWFALTRDVLPAIAEEVGWPIREDHCFMRVCLDNAFGRPWREVVAAPAYRTMSDDQLAAAVALAESVAAEPGGLLALNARSLAWRRKAQAAVMPPTSP